ncbi:hypothetical protein N2152v2_004249 [Parachlorella kessleri]
MVLLEDPITADPTSRLLTEEDEELAQKMVDQYTVAPSFEVFLLGPSAALLASTLFQQAKALGTISVPELQRLRSPYDEEYGGRTVIHKSLILSLSEEIVLVVSDKPLPPEQAATWADAACAALQPAAVVITTTIPAMEYRGPGSPADEDLIYSLASPAATAPAPPSSGSRSVRGSSRGAPPPLPPGSLLGGLPAALLVHCVQQELPAEAVVGVQLGPAPDAKFVHSLAEGLLGALEARVGRQLGPPLVLGGAELLPALKAAVDKLYRGSVSNSIFI